MPLVCSVPNHLDLHPYKGPSKYLGIYTEICEKKKKKNTYLQKLHFSPKNWEPTEKNMTSNKSRDP